MKLWYILCLRKPDWSVEWAKLKNGHKTCQFSMEPIETVSRNLNIYLPAVFGKLTLSEVGSFLSYLR